jgi:hypothetical protein
VMSGMFEARMNGDSYKLHCVKELKAVAKAVIVIEEENETVNC